MKLEKILSNILKESIVIDPNYGNRKGYDRDFLGIPVELPAISQELQSYAAIFDDKNYILKYHHFSIVMNKKRKLPFYTAVNIDARSYNKIKNKVPTRKKIGNDKWMADNRISPNFQIPLEFYKNNDFDLGHLVRREDPVWGNSVEIAIKANNDTFHLTNASPQHKDFNQRAKNWRGLEDYALINARQYGLRITVFSGPVCTDGDKMYRDVQIPSQYWKIIVMIKKDGSLSATGYLLSQKDLVKDIIHEGFVFGRYRTYQVPVSKIERLTGLQFNLDKYDPLYSKLSLNEASLQFPREIKTYKNIKL